MIDPALVAEVRDPPAVAVVPSPGMTVKTEFVASDGERAEDLGVATRHPSG
jgi:hypothetical protein